MNFSNDETYIMKYYYGLFILDKHNRKIWLPVISDYMALKYKNIFIFELIKHEEEEHINLKLATVGYALCGTAGAVLDGMNTNETNKYEILITLNNAQKLLIENLDKQVA